MSTLVAKPTAPCNMLTKIEIFVCLLRAMRTADARVTRNERFWEVGFPVAETAFLGNYTTRKVSF
jgi:hypothetical protein